MDLIERQVAIRKLKRMATQAYIDKLKGNAEAIINCCIDDIERQIPSAQPEPCEDDNTVNLHITKIKKHVSDFSDLNEDSEVETQMSLPEREDVPDINVGKIDGDKLDAAIRHEDRAAERYSEAHNQFHDNVDPADAECCLNRTARHRQLASWLRELQRLREQGTCDDAVSREAVYEAMVEKGQHSRRYKVGEIWELNGEEIREALDMVPSISPKQSDYKTDHGYMWICPDCGLMVHSDFEKCVRCGHKREE